MKSSRLWPVASSLVLLISGSLAAEYLARHRDAETVSIAIVDGALADADDAEDWSELPSEVVSEQHVLARQYAKRGDYDLAFQAYRALLQTRPEDVLLSVELGHWFARAGKLTEAKDLFTSALHRSPTEPRALLELGLLEGRMGDVTAATMHLEQALAARPNHTLTRIALGDLLRQVRQYQRAIEALEPAAASGTNEERARALSALGRCLMAQGQHERARPLLREAVERAPASVNTWLSTAYAYLESHDSADVESALANAVRVTRLAPELGLGFRLMARVQERRGQKEAARLAYVRSVELDPASDSGRKRLLRLALDDDDFKTAREQARALLETSPNVAINHFLAGLVESRDEHAEQAIAHYKKAIELEGGKYPEAWFNLGKSYAQADQTRLAIEAYQKAIDGKPDYIAAWNNLGRAHLDDKQLDKAAECFERALGLDPNYGLAWHNLGKLRYDQERYPEAVKAYERAVELSPDDRSLVLKHAITLRKAGDEQGAIGVYEKLLAQQPRYVTAWFNLGVALAANERLADAKNAYEKALELEPEHAKALKNLGYLEAKLGHVDRARQYLTDALDHDPKDEDTRLRLAELHLEQSDFRACRSEAERVLAQNESSLPARAMLNRCGR